MTGGLGDAKKFLQKNRKPLLAALGAVLCAASFALFQESVRQERLGSRANGQANTLAVTAFMLENIAARSGYDFSDGFYEAALLESARFIGRRPAVFAAVYDLNLTELVTIQPHEGRYFNPAGFPDFRYRALTEASGGMPLLWEGRPGIDMRVNWRWVFRETERPLLLVAAASKHSLESRALGFTVAAVFAVFFALFLFLCGSIAYFVYDMHKTYRRNKTL